MHSNEMTPMVSRLKAFTLVEMLAVVAIILLLLSIMMPTLSHTTDRMQDVVCRSNMRSMGHALNNYLMENERVTPFCYARSQGVVFGCWPPRLRQYLNYDNDVFWCPSRDSSWKWRQIYRGDPGAPAGGHVRYANDQDVRSYAFRKDEMLPVATVVPFSYGWNDWGTAHAFTHAGMGGDEWPGPGRWKITLSMIANPASMIAITDKQPTPPNQWWGFNIDPTSWWEHPAQHHDGGCNVIWADGHACWKPIERLVIGDNTNNPNSWNDEQKEIARYWNNNFHWIPRR